MPPTDLLRVRDLVPDFLACARRSGPPESWTSRYLAGHPDVVRALRRDGDWSDATGVASVLDGLRDRAADLAARAERVRAALPDAVAEIRKLAATDRTTNAANIMIVRAKALGWRPPARRRTPRSRAFRPPTPPAPATPRSCSFGPASGGFAPFARAETARS